MVSVFSAWKEGREHVCVDVCIGVSSCVFPAFILGCAPVFEQGFTCLCSEMCL